uniref:Secreted protein n=1 Tax=Anopheles darlingi TaxID=43151 RepID=A0A2M4DFN8_ANODA
MVGAAAAVAAVPMMTLMMMSAAAGVADVAVIVHGDLWEEGGMVQMRMGNIVKLVRASAKRPPPPRDA